MDKPSAPISSAAEVPVKTSATPATEKDLTEPSPSSGTNSRASFAFFALESSSLRTSQRSLDGDWHEFSETLPRAGTMQSGKLSRLPMSARPTVETDSSCWPTPTASEYGSCVGGEAGRVGPIRPSLSTMAREWPTPVAADCGRASGPTPTAKLGDDRRGAPSIKTAAKRYDQGKRNLDDAAALWPTPRATDGTKGGPNQHGSAGDLMLPSAAVQALWPTPRANEAGDYQRDGRTGRTQPTLTGAITGFKPGGRAAHRWPPGPNAIQEWDGAQPAVRRSVTRLSGRLRRSDALRLLAQLRLPPASGARVQNPSGTRVRFFPLT